MRIDKFEDLICWQKAREASLLVYRLFKNNRDFGFKDQIQRASISVQNNIAEGFERATDKELRQFLYIAKGSCGEVRSMSYIAKDLGYINQKEFEKLNALALDASRLIGGFIRKL
jgi:four helix bundle protein